MYFQNLNPADICDNKKFWKIVKPYFSEKSTSTENITLVENNKIVNNDTNIAEIFNEMVRQPYRPTTIRYDVVCTMGTHPCIYTLVIVY